MPENALLPILIPNQHNTMNEPQHVPSPEFEAKEVDSLIAEFGVAMSPEKREELHQHLGAKKEQFLGMDQNRGQDKNRDQGLSR